MRQPYGRYSIADSRKSHYDDTMAGGYFLNDPSLVETLVNKAAAAVDWLISLGADLSNIGQLAGSSHKRTHRPDGGAAIGPYLMAVLSKAVKSENISVRTRNNVTALTEQNGKVTGVKVSTPAGTYTIKAKAVIIATGGFGANLSMTHSVSTFEYAIVEVDRKLIHFTLSLSVVSIKQHH